jgi:hypothetical protein
MNGHVFYGSFLAAALLHLGCSTAPLTSSTGTLRPRPAGSRTAFSDAGDYYGDGATSCTVGRTPVGSAVPSDAFAVPRQGIDAATLAHLANWIKPSTLRAQGYGAHVRVYRVSGDSVDGELLSVRDSVLILCTQEDEREKYFLGNLDAVTLVGRYDITHVIVKGERKVFEGMARGAAAGMGFGAVTGAVKGYGMESGFLSFPRIYAFIYAATLGAAGFLYGTIAGVSASAPDRRVATLSDETWPRLREYSLDLQ